MIGIDIAHIERFRKLEKADFEHWGKYFSITEWEYCFAKPNPAQHVAGVFAAKEAIMKAGGADLMGQYDAIEIVHADNGQPQAHIKNGMSIAISITHDQGVAAAVALVQ